MHVGTVCTWELYSHAQLRGKIAEDIILGVCYKAILFVKSGWISSWLPSWCPTSLSQLKDAEDKMLKCNSVCVQHVQISNVNHLWTLPSLQPQLRLPLVLLHGFGGVAGLWAQNLDSLCGSGAMNALNLLWFGQSSQTLFSEWRDRVGLEEIVLLGHNLAAAYTLTHPHRVKHLILVEPWGFPARPESLDQEKSIPVWIRAMGAVMSPFNPLAGLRLAGPLDLAFKYYLLNNFQIKLFRWILTHLCKTVCHNFLPGTG
uniref:1-acylglycerol-3-phosphate O-acyltransferase ABHD5 n=1 Tax=Oncorhynchus mykiss TaxID=8022 RepID=A0A8C7TLG1_ONCMY